MSGAIHFYLPGHALDSLINETHASPKLALDVRRFVCRLILAVFLI